MHRQSHFTWLVYLYSYLSDILVLLCSAWAPPPLILCSHTPALGDISLTSTLILPSPSDSRYARPQRPLSPNLPQLVSLYLSMICSSSESSKLRSCWCLVRTSLICPPIIISMYRSRFSLHFCLALRPILLHPERLFTLFYWRPTSCLLGISGPLFDSESLQGCCMPLTFPLLPSSSSSSSEPNCQLSNLHKCMSSQLNFLHTPSHHATRTHLHHYVDPNAHPFDSLVSSQTQQAERTITYCYLIRASCSVTLSGCYASVLFIFSRPLCNLVQDAGFIYA